jgi:hypothetical protein
MGRVNKTINGVFIDIVGNDREISCYEQFINQDDINSSQLRNLIKQYDGLVQKNKPTFEKLARLEEIIIQLRIRHTLNNVKLTLVREYIYARTPFYRKDKKAKDVRIIVDKVDHWPAPLSELTKNNTFMDIARKKLAQTMDFEIQNNIETLMAQLTNGKSLSV